MFHKVLVSVLALSMAAGAVALAQAQDAGENSASATANRSERGPSGFLSRLDTDGNGSIAPEEFGGDRMEMLRAADENNDGTLTQEELTDYVMKREFQRRAERLANRLDIDGDGKVTIAELEDRQGKRFALLDRNNDGALSQNELRSGGFGKRAMHMHGMGDDGPRYGQRRGEGPRHKFMHRMEPAAPVAPGGGQPAEE